MSGIVRVTEIGNAELQWEFCLRRVRIILKDGRVWNRRILDPELLREQVPQVLGFIREWVRRADGDDLELLLQALNVRVEVSREVANIRVEVPMIEGVGGKSLATTARTSV